MCSQCLLFITILELDASNEMKQGIYDPKIICHTMPN